MCSKFIFQVDNGGQAVAVDATKTSLMRMMRTRVNLTDFVLDFARAVFTGTARDAREINFLFW